MKKYHILLIAILTTFSSCVENPNVTEETYLTTPDATNSWVVGLKRKIALMLNATVVNMEILSDNYFNNYSQYSKVFDKLQIDYFDVDVNNIQSNIHQVRSMAQFGLDKVIPSDPTTTPSQKAYMYFALAYSHLLAGELFIGLPATERGEVLSWEKHLELAIKNFDEAIKLEPDAELISAYRLFIARAYYRLGDASNAVAYAEMVKDKRSLVYEVEFDGVNGVSNEMQNAVYGSLPNRLAPLPRLDFLDPKYYYEGTSSTDQKSMAILKVEEAYLIIAEAQASNNQLVPAQATLQDLLDVVNMRPVALVDDSKEKRDGGNNKNYPLAEVDVKFDGNDNSPKQGYVLNRQNGKIPVYTVSGTKVTAGDIAAATAQDELLYIIYRLRQEIFMAEGRRVSDLGIRLSVSQNEEMSNPNVNDSHIKAQVPAFIPKDLDMDAFTYDKENGLVTMKYDMNKVLIENKTSPFIVPFIK
ncbi:MAG: tetratricopeptide repeat protein [Prevotellaceae bacterium]|jgi:tetratricopeptide (TPR) repeat protein|nr:tetratricopeptide repeat protein [Prevotellaceae bacterium]